MGLFGFGKKKSKVDEGFRYYCMGLDDTEHKKEYFEKSAALGCRHGKAALARYYWENEVHSVENLERAAALYEEAEADGAKLNYEKLGRIYSELKRDVQALECYRKAADEGDAYSQFMLGRAYFNGIGTDIDYEKSVFWYEKGAAQKHRESLNNLGVMYARGEGVAKDLERAARLYEDAADLGNTVACGNIANYYYKGEGVGQNYEKARQYAEKGMEKEDLQSQWILAQLYKDGLSVKKDSDKARMLLKDLEKKNYKKASETLREMDAEKEALAEEFYQCSKKPFDLGMLKRAADLGHVKACKELAEDGVQEGGLFGSDKKLEDVEMVERLHYCEQAAEAGEDMEQARKSLLEILERRAVSAYVGRRLETARYIFEATRPYKDFISLCCLGTIYYQEGKFKETVDVLYEAITHPDSMRHPETLEEAQYSYLMGLYNLGLNYAKEGLSMKAEEILEKAVAYPKGKTFSDAETFSKASDLIWVAYCEVQKQNR